MGGGVGGWGWGVEAEGGAEGGCSQEEVGRWGEKRRRGDALPQGILPRAFARENSAAARPPHSPRPPRGPRPGGSLDGVWPQCVVEGHAGHAVGVRAGVQQHPLWGRGRGVRACVRVYRGVRAEQLAAAHATRLREPTKWHRHITCGKGSKGSWAILWVRKRNKPHQNTAPRPPTFAVDRVEPHHGIGAHPQMHQARPKRGAHVARLRPGAVSLRPAVGLLRPRGRGGG